MLFKINSFLDALTLQGLEAASVTVQSLLTNLANNENFISLIKQAFGDNFDEGKAEQLRQEWVNGDFTSLPEIEIRGSEEINGALGAFSSDTNRIYLSQGLINNNRENSEPIVSVLLAEVGHFVDSKINITDAVGDEGDIFSALALGKSLTESQLQQLKSENDQATITLDGQVIEIEQASVSDGGGFEGSNKTIKLESKGGGVAKFSYEHYFIPDKFIIRYEGKELLNTGFVGGSKSGEVQIPKGNSDILEVIVATDNEGTAWYYTVTTDTCPDTKNLVIEAVGGKFEDKDQDGDCDFNGTVLIGRKNGITQMLRVEGATAEYDDKELRIKNGTVFSVIGGVNKPLFRGSFTIPLDTAVTSSLNDDLQNLAGDFKLGGLDVNLKKFSLNQNGIGLGYAWKLPDEIGGISIDYVQDTVYIRNNGVSLGASGKLNIDNPPKFSFFKLFDVEASDLSLEYNGTEEKLKLQGKFAFDSFVKETPVKKVTADLAGDNYVQIKDGKPDIKGSLTVETELQTSTGWGLSEIKLDIDTQKKDIGGSTKITFPFKGRISEAELGLGFKLPIPPLELNKVSINVDKLNVPIPGYPLVFFQRFAGAVENFAPSDKDAIEFSGGLGATLGPQFDVPGLGSVALLRLDVDGKISREEMSVTGKTIILNEKIATSQGTKTLNWNEKFYKEEGSYSILDGLIKTDNSFRLDSSFNIKMGGKASANVPKFIPKIGGKNLTNAEFQFNFSNDGNLSNDSAAVFSKFDASFFGFSIETYLGFRGYFDGRIELIASSLPPTNSFIIAPDTKWIFLTADWTNPSNNVNIRIKKPDGTFVEEADFDANKIAIFDELTDSDTRTAIVINPVPGVWDIEVVDDQGLGTVEYSAIRDSVAPTIQVTEPSVDVSGGENVAIGYNAFDADSIAKVSLFYDTDNQGFDGILIADNLIENDGAGTFLWNTEGIPTGDYYIYAMVIDENNPPNFSYSPGRVQISEEADLIVTQTANTNSVIAGNNLTYTITVTNNGLADAKSVNLIEILPEGVTLVSTTPTPALQAGKTLVFELGNLAKGASKTFQITATAPQTPGTITATAFVNSQTFDSDSTNDISSLTSTVTEIPPFLSDLLITRTDNAGSVNLGEQYVYTLTVINNGPDDATGVVLTENLPSGVNLISQTLSQGFADFDFFNQKLTADIGTINSGQQATVNITVTPFVAGNLISTTSVTSNEPDPNPVNNELIDTQVVNPRIPDPADLELTQTVNNLNPKVGDSITFTLTLTNKGPGIASGIKVTDLLPPELTFINYYAAQGSYDSSTGIWDVGNMRDNLSRTLTIVAQVNAPGSITTTAEITAVNEADPDSTPGNHNPNEDDQASVTIATPLPVDLSVRRTDTPASILIGDTYTYALTVTNKDSQDATNVILTENLPSGLDLVSVKVGNFVDFIKLQLDAGAKATIDVDAGEFASKLDPVLRIFNSVGNQVAFNDDNPAPGEGFSFDPYIEFTAPTTDTYYVGVSSFANIDYSPFLGEANKSSSTFDEYDIIINVGGGSGTPAIVPLTQPNNIISEAFDSGLNSSTPATFVGRGLLGPAKDAQVQINNGVITANLGNLKSNESQFVYVTVTPIESGEVVTTTNVTSNEPDLNPSDNSLTNQKTIGSVSLTSADLELTQTVDKLNPQIGDFINITLTLTNKGPGAASRVKVTDFLPQQLGFISANANQGTYFANTGEWNVGQLGNGLSTSLTLKAKVILSGDITNTASVAKSDQPDPDSTPGNNNANEDDQTTVTLTILSTQGTDNNDVLTGTSANEVFAGGLGADVLTGGGGSDIFVYHSFRDRGDRITDFSPADDRLDLSEIFASTSYGSTTPFSSYLRFVQLGTNTDVQINPVGDSRNIFRSLVTLENVTAADLTVSNFIL